MTRPMFQAEFSTSGGELEQSYDPEVYKTLLESTLAIPWKIDWATKRFTYVGPQIEEVLGWSQESWITVEDWASRIHSEDRDHVVSTCVAQSQAGIDHEADYRALTKDDGFIWIRDVVHVVRDEDGNVDSLIGFMFDISERKKMEQELLRMQQKLEALSYEDGLTGVANRRLFDERMNTECNNARIAQRPLSMILLDIDHFKQFNDHYGHVQGDECLVQVARALKQVGRRDSDIVARYGGEEFVLLLPETDEQTALEMAEQCRKVIEDLQIEHQHSSCSAVVTASIGVATVAFDKHEDLKNFSETVDRLLYAAKRNGRNQVVSANQITNACTGTWEASLIES